MQQTQLGAVIRALRKKNNMTQAALAEKLGVTDKAVSKWERGISYPDIIHFPELARVFDMSIDELVKDFTDKGQPTKLVQIFRMTRDLRTPLNIILGCADMAMDHIDEKERTLRYLQNIRVSGQYMLNIMEHAKNGEYPEIGDLLQKELSDRIQSSSGESGASVSCSPELDAFDFSGKRILLAEDFAINREIIFEMLKKTGAEVEFAEDGKVCVEKIIKSPPGRYDLILMDIKMPNMDGIQATTEIRKLPDSHKSAIPIIAMTAKVYDKDRQAAFEAGMDDFTEKPIVTHTLLATMKQHL